MSRKWVINASPTIALAKISQIGLLSELCSELVIPQGVVQEIECGPENDPARIWLADGGSAWIREVSQIDPEIADYNLGLGESEVMAWAYHHAGFEAILDDRAAKNAARMLGIPVRGTISIILLAKQEGRVSQVKPLLDQLVQKGLRVSPSVLEAALKLVNESG